MIDRSNSWPVILSAAVLLVGCGGTKGSPPSDLDAATDTVSDAMGDTAPDGGDVVSDTGLDVPPDATGDTTADSATDAPLDSDAGDDAGTDPMPEPHPDGTDVTDSDGDTIRDADEGGGAVDTDSDGTPDSLDEDSDGDGIPDSYEAGDDDPLTPPVDTDFDGDPDFQDTDSDNDTIRDADEGIHDPDGDGIPNYRDLDSDGDYLQDYFEAGDDDPGTGPINHDGDADPDYLDADSDNDTISDMDESNIDTGDDGSYDFLNTDSDGDTIPDSSEAGDADLDTPPENCDDDPLPNYRDTDSDNDGVSDSDELIVGTGLCDPDSDDDGVTDMVEIAYDSDPLDSGDSPLAHGDFVFQVPYEESPSPLVDTLVFSTDLQMADVYFLVDTTGSMNGEIVNLRNAIAGTLIPDIRAAIPDTWFGVGHFDDYPNSACGYGSEFDGDVVFNQLQRMTSSTSQAQTAANNLPLHYGVDNPESNIPALYHLVTGTGEPAYGLSAGPACGGGYTGYACFRDEAVKIAIMISDAMFHNGPSGYNYNNGCLGVVTPTYSQTVTACLAENVKVIGVHSDTWSTDYDYRQLALATGTVDSGGNPLVYQIPGNGTGLGSQIVNAVEDIANNVPIRVDALVSDDPSDAVDAVASFVDNVHSNTSGTSIWDPVTSSMRVCTNTSTATPGTPPTVDYFSGVLPGQSVCFDIHPKVNTTVPPTTHAQLYMAVIDIIGDLYTPLDSRDIYFLVPPEIPGGN
jgi:hypothetical protein